MTEIERRLHERVEIRSEDGKLLCEGLFSMFAVEMPFVPLGPDRVADRA